MAGLSRKDRETVLRSLEEQGAALVAVKKGTLVRFPDGSTAMFHTSNSDHRATLNQRALVLRAGFQWPFDSQTK